MSLENIVKLLCCIIGFFVVPLFIAFINTNYREENDDEN